MTYENVHVNVLKDWKAGDAIDARSTQISSIIKPAP